MQVPRRRLTSPWLHKLASLTLYPKSLKLITGISISAKAPNDFGRLVWNVAVEQQKHRRDVNYYLNKLGKKLNSDLEFFSFLLLFSVRFPT